MGSGRRRYASGLTLLEMMVVLMIAGMALALLIGGCLTATLLTSVF